MLFFISPLEVEIVYVCSVEDRRRGVGRVRHGRRVLKWPWKSLSSELPPVIGPSLKSWHGHCPWHRQRSERAQDWAPVPLEPDNDQMASSRLAFIWDTVKENDGRTIIDCVTDNSPRQTGFGRLAFLTRVIHLFCFHAVYYLLCISQSLSLGHPIPAKRFPISLGQWPQRAVKDHWFGPSCKYSP